MPKIVFIGAGSFGFTRNLVRDVLTFPLLENAEIALVDINKQRLDFARRACQKLVDQGGYPAKVTATTERREALKGADAVLVREQPLVRVVIGLDERDLEGQLDPAQAEFIGVAAIPAPAGAVEFTLAVNYTPALIGVTAFFESAIAEASGIGFLTNTLAVSY